MDKFEEYIRKNRVSLDQRKPPSKVWKAISKDLKGKRSTIPQWLSIAATITLLAGITFIFLHKAADNNNIDSGNGNIAMANSQLRETEAYYNNIVNTLYTEAAPLLTKNPDVKSELNTDLSHLDSICVDLKKDLKDNISNKDVVEALIRNYRIKIQILEDMLTVLRENDTTNVKKTGHEL